MENEQDHQGRLGLGLGLKNVQVGGQRVLAGPRLHMTDIDEIGFSSWRMEG